MLEGRAVYDAAAMVPMLGLKKCLPQGDNHPVLVFPGFLASSHSTRPLRQYLADLGYRSHRWKLGYNMGYSYKLHYGMRDRVTELVERYGEKISLVGWSLGGVYARELAREMPDIVRQVISMGSPFRGHPSSSNSLLVGIGMFLLVIPGIIPATHGTRTTGSHHCHVYTWGWGRGLAIYRGAFRPVRC